jgi:hypothetical protein
MYNFLGIALANSNGRQVERVHLRFQQIGTFLSHST